MRKFLEYLQFSQEEANQLITHQYGGAYNKDNLICRATICGKQIVENLRKLGVRQAKSGKEVPYICESPELEIAYIRGLLDGDGYIRTTQYGVGIVGSEIMMEYIRDFFAKHLNWEQTQDKYIHPHGKIYKFCKQRVYEFQVYIYFRHLVRRVRGCYCGNLYYVRRG